MDIIYVEGHGISKYGMYPFVKNVNLQIAICVMNLILVLVSIIVLFIMNAKIPYSKTSTCSV